MSDGGKGSRQRPTDKQKFDENYDKIFGKKKDLYVDQNYIENEYSEEFVKEFYEHKNVVETKHK